MKHEWKVHGRNADVHELYIQFDGELRIVGWVGPSLARTSGFHVFCHWIDDGDYPENKVFETAKQARRALKSAATIAVVGGWRPTNF
jgi:hypothetical protein